jgi:Ricin-type beta-trefoil lectin domain/Domain of unknown function DUF11
VPPSGPRRLRAAAAVLAAALLAALTFGTPAASAAAATIGPAQISALGHPSLCWQAWGNGSPVTLEKCDAASQGQQWSLTSNGVLMNGNGYCLEAATGRAAPLFIDFAGQCGGGRGQVWRYTAGLLASARTGACAGLGGPAEPGAGIIRLPCTPQPNSAERAAIEHWSIGYSAVTLTPGTGTGAAGGTFTGSVTVANAASAQAAYGVTVTFTLPPGSTATALRPAAGWSCQLRAARCTGTLAAGASGRIALTGQLPASAQVGSSLAIAARALVTGTTQRSRRARTTAAVTVAVRPPAPAPAASGQAALPLVAAAAGVLLLGGGLLVALTRRRRPAAG